MPCNSAVYLRGPPLAPSGVRRGGKPAGEKRREGEREKGGTQCSVTGRNDACGALGSRKRAASAGIQLMLVAREGLTPNCKQGQPGSIAAAENPSPEREKGRGEGITHGRWTKSRGKAPPNSFGGAESDAWLDHASVGHVTNAA